MYVRDGKKMPEREEGAAFFKPISGPDEPEIWGVPRGLLEHGFGADPPAAMPSDEQAALESGATNLDEVTVTGDPNAPVPFYESTAYRLFALAGAGVGAYHGYKRNDSVWWALGWGFLGSIFPIFVIPIAFAQGIGKPKGR